jgi:glutathione S-transferase
MTSRLHLFYSPGACSLAPHVVLEELGIPYECTRVTIAEGLNQKPDYLAINPRGRVPALAIGGSGDVEAQVLTEAMAILVYLAQAHPQAKLLPSEGLQLARALEWMSWLGSTIHQTGVRPVLRPDRFLGEAGADATGQVKRKGLEMVERGMIDIDGRLRGRAFAMGDHFSVVDAYLLVFFRWGNRVGLPMRQGFPEFTRVMDGVRGRPAVQRAVNQEQIEIE